jgi:hypothetical protein
MHGSLLLLLLLPLLLLPPLQTNCATGEVLAEPNIERIVWVIDKLQLAQQQQQTIAQGSAVARKLLTPVMEELRELQLQQGGEDTCHYTSGMEGLSLAGDAGDDAAAAAGAAPSGAAAAADYYQQPMFSAAAGMPCSSRTSSSHTAGDAAGSNHDGGRHEDGSDGMQQQAAAAAPRQRYAGSSAYRRSLLLQQQRLDRMKLLMRKVGCCGCTAEEPNCSTADLQSAAAEDSCDDVHCRLLVRYAYAEYVRVACAVCLCRSAYSSLVRYACAEVRTACLAAT